MSFATSYERYFADLVNQSRSANGLSALKIEKRLNDSADAHSKWMLNADVFSHTGKGGSSSRERMEAAGFDLSGQWLTAENIAYVSVQGESDLRDEIRQLHQNLMDSPGHYKNIMGAASFIGIGLQVGDFRYQGRDYKVLMVTQNFADTDGQVRLDTGGFQKVALPTPATAMPTRADWLKDFDGKVFTAAATGTAKNDEFRLGARNDAVAAGSGNDWVAGGAGNDTLRGGNGNDRQIGDRGADLLDGGAGNDTVQGGAGSDRLLGGSGNDLLRGNEDNDRFAGGTGNDRMFGGTGNDRLAGEDGADWLLGEAGNDTLLGGAGNDTLRGGAGTDLLNGGTGIDSFIFAKGSGVDRVQAYEQGVDRILIAKGMLDSNPSAFIRDHMTLTASGVVIDFGGGDKLVVAGSGVTVSGVADDIFSY